MRRPSTVLVSLIAVGSLVLGLSACGGSAADSAYDAEVAKIVNRLSDSATAISGALISASAPGDVASVRSAAQSQFRLVSSVLGSVTDLETPADQAATTMALRQAVLANRKYLAGVKRSASEDPTRGLRAIPATRRAGALMLSDYRGFFEAAPPSATDGITDVGITDLSGLTKAQKAAAAAAEASEPAPAPTEATQNAMSDIVDNSGGEGVRYRYTPYLYDVVPGNGPLEGDRVYISCFTTGEVVKGSSWWARLTNGYYVPTAYLRSSVVSATDTSSYC